MFGHAYLRLGVSENPSPDDLVIEFIADVGDRNVNYITAMGLWRPYKRIVVFKPYSDIWAEMTMVAHRDLTSYELNLSPDQKDVFLNELKSFVEKGEMGNYSYLKNNCAEGVSRLLEDSQVSSQGFFGHIPIAIPEKLKRADLVVDISIDHSRTSHEANERLLSEVNGENLPYLVGHMASQLKTPNEDLIKFIKSEYSDGKDISVSKILSKFKKMK